MELRRYLANIPVDKPGKFPIRIHNFAIEEM